LKIMLSGYFSDNGAVVGPFEEEEEGIGIASDVVKVEGEDPPPSGCLREDRVRRYVGDSQSWVCAPLARSRGNPGNVTILLYRFNKTKQHADTVELVC